MSTSRFYRGRMQIRRVHAHEAAVLRDVRLRMLEDSPEAYSTKLADAQAYDFSVWEGRAAMQHAGFDEASILAFAQDYAVGSVTGIPMTPEARQLVAMWVDPAYRGMGVGRKLVEALVQWAWRGPATRLALWVVDSNEPAKALYRSMGFRPTEDSQPLPSHPDLQETHWELLRPARGR